MKIQYLLGFIACLVMIEYVAANAGLAKPIPRVSCDLKNKKGCSIKSACAKRNPNDAVNPIYISESYDIAIFQKLSFHSSNSSNTYTLQYYPDKTGNVTETAANTGIQLITFNQNDMNANNSMYAVKLDPLATNEKLMAEISWDEEGYSYGYAQLTFDTRSGSGTSFYSCSNVRLQKTKPKASNSTATVQVDSTLTITDGEGNSLGNATISANGGTLSIPSMVDPDAKTKSSQEQEIGGNTQPAAGEEEEHSAGYSIQPPASPIFYLGACLTIVISFLLQ
ncbi:hypothetical protein CYY_007908 [Polysphondylium violaceum]|uniref:Reelin domain-containing protein n=1 Tax=Polysphondylium violaceum TaxID=133409 RepID=A0A8J4PQ26_9MYCE|nr:hypothetical protein CYY_007908 [Polysphondylium violaceum]